MLDFSAETIGWIYIIIFILITGTFIIYAIIKVFGFEEPKLNRCLQFWVLYLIIIYSFGFILKQLFSLSGWLEMSDVDTKLIIVNSIISFISLAALLGLTKHWFKESWAKTIAAAILFFIAQIILVLASFLIPGLLISSINH